VVAKGKRDNSEILLNKRKLTNLFTGGGTIRKLRSVWFFSVASGCQLFGLFRYRELGALGQGNVTGMGKRRAISLIIFYLLIT